MIFTVAERVATEAGLATGKPFMMRGQGSYPGHPRYRGGAVFLTREGAEAFIAAKPDELKDWAVYGCDADWEKHAVQYPDEEHGRLCIDRPIVSLDAA